MGQALALREDYGAGDLKRLARISNDANQVRRLLAIAAVLEGASRTEAAKVGHADIQTLRDWVINYNRQGPDGLIDRKRSGRNTELTAEQLKKFGLIVEMGPTPDLDGIVRWRLGDLKRAIWEHFRKDVCEMTVSRYLKKLGFSHISARPQHPRQDAQIIEAFKKTSPKS